MAKVDTPAPKLTRGDKAHRKFMDKLDTFKDGLTHGLDSITTIHKQGLDSSSEYYEKVSKSQELERSKLYRIIETCEDETKCKEAYARLKELDHIKEEEIRKHDELIQSERDKAYKNIAGGIIVLGTACGLIYKNKQVRQALTTMGKNILQIK